jgi:hypothetical protein
MDTKGHNKKSDIHKEKNIINLVRGLIVPTTNTWDVHMLNQTLEKEDVQDVLQIAVFNQFEDFLA